MNLKQAMRDSLAEANDVWVGFISDQWVRKYTELLLSKLGGEAAGWMTANDWGNDPLVTSIRSVVDAWKYDSRKVSPLFLAQPPDDRDKRIAELEAELAHANEACRTWAEDFGKAEAERDAAVKDAERYVVGISTELLLLNTQHHAVSSRLRSEYAYVHPRNAKLWCDEVIDAAIAQAKEKKE